MGVGRVMSVLRDSKPVGDRSEWHGTDSAPAEAGGRVEGCAVDSFAERSNRLIG